MKLTRLSLMTALAVSGWMASSASAQPQSTNAAPASLAIATNAPARPPRRSPADLMSARLQSALGLNETQGQKVKAAYEAFFKQRAATQGIPQQEAKEKRTQAQAELDKAMKEILTPEQYTKWPQVVNPPRRAPGAAGGPGAHVVAEHSAATNGAAH